MPIITLFSLVPNSLFNTCSVIMGKTLNVSSYYEPDIKFFSRWHWKDTGGGKASPAGTGAVHWKVVRMGAIWVVLCPDTHPEHTISQWPPSSCLVWWSLPSALKHRQWVAGLPPTVVLNSLCTPACLTTCALGTAHLCFTGLLLAFSDLEDRLWPRLPFKLLCHTVVFTHIFSSEVWTPALGRELPFIVCPSLGTFSQHYIPFFFFFLNNGPILFCLYIFNILYIYLAVPAPSYGTQDLWFSLMACGIVAVKRKTEEWVFLFPFPENKKAKENSEQAWTFLGFFFFFHFNCS